MQQEAGMSVPVRFFSLLSSAGSSWWILTEGLARLLLVRSLFCDHVVATISANSASRATCS
jgi:hypothetical protein